MADKELDDILQYYRKQHDSPESVDQVRRFREMPQQDRDELLWHLLMDYRDRASRDFITAFNA